MTDKQTQIDKVLANFVSSTTSIQAAAVMTRDGHLVASNLHAEVDANRMSAISASLLSLADRATKDMQQGDLKQVLIDSTDGFILMLKVGDNAVLSVVSRPNSQLGMLLHDAKKSAVVLAKLI